jgi:hypothetical protein
MYKHTPNIISNMYTHSDSYRYRPDSPANFCKLTAVGTCNTDACAFSAPIPTSTLTQPATDSSEVVTLMVTYNIVFANGAKKRQSVTYKSMSSSRSASIIVSHSPTTSGSDAVHLARSSSFS